MQAQSQEEQASSAPPPSYYADDNNKAGYGYAQPTVAGPAGPTVYINQQPAGQPSVVFVQPAALRYDKYPVQIQCPHCQNAVTTHIETKAGALPWLVCGGLMLVGCWLGCCLIPFCIADLQDCHHYCPNCKAFVGVYNRMN